MNVLHNLGAALRRNALVVAGGILVLGLYTYRLAGITHGQLAPVEQVTLHASNSLHTIADSPLFLPINAVRWLFLKLLPGHELLALRAPSVMLGLFSVLSLGYIIRRWYGHRVMWFGIATVVCSAWLLHVSRLATNDVVYVAVVSILLGLHVLLHEHPGQRSVVWVWAATIALLLYVPGMIWLVIANLIWQRQDLQEAWSARKAWQRILLALGIIVLLVPLAYAFTQSRDLATLLSWAGLPTGLPSWQQPLKNLAAALLFLVARTPADPTLWLGRLPLFDAFLTVSFVAGIFFYGTHLAAPRTRLLLAFGLVALLLCAAGGPVGRSVLVPLAYLVALGGMAYILHQWLKLFPKNPLARRLGIGLLAIAVLLSCTYNLRQYFVAWPHNQDTIATFTKPSDTP